MAFPPFFRRVRAGRLLLSLVCLILAHGAGFSATETPYLNLDFESPGRVRGWFAGGQGYEGVIDTVTVYSGKQSLRLRKISDEVQERAFGVATGTFPYADVAGKSIRYTGYIKTEDVSEGWAGLWWRVDTPGGVSAFDNMAMRPVTGDTDWKRYEINLEVDSTVTNINFGALLTGKGTAWIDSLNVYVDGELYPQPGEEALEPTPEAVEWVREHAIPFETVVPGSGFDDLAPLKEMVGDALIVALGEVTHGSRDIFRMKHRIFEYLAENMGFRVFAIEANMPETYRMNDYVLKGEGDPREILDGMYFWTWNTQEVLDFANWMRSYNESGKGPLQFVGFDMQYPEVAQEIVEKFLSEHDPEGKKSLEEALSTLAEYSDEDGRRRVREGKLTGSERERINTSGDMLLAHLEASRSDYLRTLSEDAVDWAMQNARVLGQATRSLTVRGRGIRDSCMAENVRWIAGQNPGEKIVLWAHNFHVSRSKVSMGHFLDQHFGKDMVVLGFSFYEGRYTARSSVNGGALTTHRAAPSPPGTVELLMHRTGIPRFFLDLRAITEESAAADWFMEPREMRSTGAVAMPFGYTVGVAKDLYDFLIFLDHTDATVCLREDFIPEPEK